MRKLIFLISIALLSANSFAAVQYSDENILRELQKNESLYSADIFSTNNYAFVVKNFILYNNSSKSQSNYYTLFHNSKLVESYGEIAYYKLCNDNSVTTIAKKSHISKPMWFIQNTKSTNTMIFDEIELVDYNPSQSRTLAFMRQNGIGYVIEMSNGNITELGSYVTLIDSEVSEDGSRYAFVVQRDDGMFYLVENMSTQDKNTETIIESGAISSLMFSQDGHRFIYKKYENGQYFLVEGENLSGPYKEINNIVFSKDGLNLAYSYRSLPITNIIETIVETPITITNIIITTNNNETTPINTNANYRHSNESSKIANINNNTKTNKISTVANLAKSRIDFSSIVNEKPEYRSLLSILLAQQAGTVRTHEYDTNSITYITTNRVVEQIDIIDILEKMTIIEEHGETLVLNNEIIAVYDSITNIGFSPNSKSFLYFNIENGLTYITDDGYKTPGYNEVTAYMYSDDGDIFSYNADNKLYMNSNLEEVDITVSDIHYLSDNSLLYKRNIYGKYVIDTYDYESAAYDEIVSIDFVKSNRENIIARNSFVFVGRRGSKYYYVDRKKIAHGPFQYTSPTRKIGTKFHSIASDGKNIILLEY